LKGQHGKADVRIVPGKHRSGDGRNAGRRLNGSLIGNGGVGFGYGRKLIDRGGRRLGGFPRWKEWAEFFFRSGWKLGKRVGLLPNRGLLPGLL
jgi:hypothetical protein